MLIPLCFIVAIIFIISIANTTKSSQSAIYDESAVVTTEEQPTPAENPKQDLTTMSFASWNETCDPLLMVVNANTPISANYTPTTVAYEDTEVGEVMQTQLNAMIKAAAADGVNLVPVSGYRSYDEQMELYLQQVYYEINVNGYSADEASDEAAKTVARPGTSEHQTGLAVDFNNVTDDFMMTSEYKWLSENADKYGFIQRYSSDKSNITGIINESWHFRYVGVENATNIKNSGLCLEEYVYNLMNEVQ